MGDGLADEGFGLRHGGVTLRGAAPHVNESAGSVFNTDGRAYRP